MSAQLRALEQVTARGDSANNGETLSDLSYPAATFRFERSRGPKGNLVGSREASSKISPRCEEVLVGTLLGDGCLERNGANVRLRIDHSIGHRAWVEWKHSEFQELCPGRPRIVKRIDVRTGSQHVNYRFSSGSLPALNEYYQLFYGEGEKRIPSDIGAFLSPLSLAVWYQDDGGRRGDCAGGYLNTNAYSDQDVELLKLALWNLFGISTRTHFAAGKPRIYVPAGQFREFCHVLRPFVIDEMKYKLL